MKYYVDTCIWLNLFKREQGCINDFPSLNISKDFVDQATSLHRQLLISPVVLKELAFKLNAEFDEKHEILKQQPCVSFVPTVAEDYTVARDIETKHNYRISFGDCLHIAITRRLNVVLVTRDAQLILVGKEYVEVLKPEMLLY